MLRPVSLQTLRKHLHMKHKLSGSCRCFTPHASKQRLKEENDEALARRGSSCSDGLWVSLVVAAAASAGKARERLTLTGAA